MKFWDVLGSQDCREKKLPTAISKQLFGVVFSTFCGPKKKKKKKIAHKKLKGPLKTVAYLWQLGVFFLCSPDCPKQPRTSFPFYKFFYPTIWSKICDLNESMSQQNV